MLLGTKITEKISNKEYTEWQKMEEKIRQVFVQHRSMENSLNKEVLDDSNQIESIVDVQMNRESENRAGEELNIRQEDNVNLFNDQIDFENFDQVFNVCHEVHSNVVYNESNVLQISTYLYSDKTICSLDHILPAKAYYYLCQYGM